jgi:carbamoyltransferase
MILGIAAYFHDSSAAIVDNGRLIAFSREERFTRIKHDSNFPFQAINYCLNKAGIGSSQISAVVFYERPEHKFSRILVSQLKDFPRSMLRFARSMTEWLGKKLWVRQMLAYKLNVSPDKIFFIPHHISHVSQSFLVSGFSEAVYLSVDAVGEWDTLVSGYVSTENGMSVTEYSRLKYPHSPGLVFSAFTSYLGFIPNSQECSLMALAAFGKPIYKNLIKKIINYTNGQIDIDSTYFKFEDPKNIFTPKFIELFGASRPWNENISFDIYQQQAIAVKENDQYYADIAASVQAVFEEVILSLLEDLFDKYKCPSLCLSGGLFLNVSLVQSIVAKSKFQRVFVPPDPGDGGSSIGAACYISAVHNKTKIAITPSELIYTGPDFTAKNILNVLPYLSYEEVKPYQYENGRSYALTYKQYPSQSTAILEDAAELLSNENVIAWFIGKTEGGPRALGNRSILAHPGSVDSARKIRTGIKPRASFRPFSLSITAEAIDDYTDMEGVSPEMLKWMQTTLSVDYPMQSKLIAGIHVNGSSRVHLVEKKDNERYHSLITQFGDITGTYALLNTSLNESGYPLINNPMDALIFFLRSEIDAIVIENVIIMKQYSCTVENQNEYDKAFSENNS